MSADKPRAAVTSGVHFVDDPPVRAPAAIWALGLIALAAPARGAGPAHQIRPIELVVALVEDPDFPPLDERVVRIALASAEREFARRFDVPPPRFIVRYRFEARRFIEVYADPRDPRCKEAFAARYLGTGVEELAPHRQEALRFLKKWPLESLVGFVSDEDKAQVRTYEDIYALYERRYVAQIDVVKRLRTPAGTPLLSPERTYDRSFVAWLCALKTQADFDVLVTNTFIAADLLTEPHPHSVFGKAKIGGIATKSPNRSALAGEALLATTFGIDTTIPELSELKGARPTLEQRGRLLGAYLLAHEIAHSVFGIPDVFDHPQGCLMTSRPGATYLDGLVELDAHPEPCPKCRPYVEARAAFDRGLTALEAGHPEQASQLFLRSVQQTPEHFHGSRRRRLAAVTMASSQAQAALGRSQRALRYARLAVKLDPASTVALRHLAGLEGPPLPAPGLTVDVSRTTSTATSGAPRLTGG